jgi:hypothetical protein
MSRHGDANQMDNILLELPGFLEFVKVLGKGPIGWVIFCRDVRLKAKLVAVKLVKRGELVGFNCVYTSAVFVSQVTGLL